MPLSGLVRCVFSESNARLHLEGSWGRGRVGRSLVSAQSSSSSSSSQSTSQSGDSWEGFNPDDYEQAEETEEEARRRNWVERGYKFHPALNHTLVSGQFRSNCEMFYRNSVFLSLYVLSLILSS